MDYPHISLHTSREEFIDHFTLTQDERYFLSQTWRKEKNFLGLAVFLKSFKFLGFPPRMKEDIPIPIVEWLSQQLNIAIVEYEKYSWKSRLWDIHLSAIRDFTGFRPGNEDDFQELIQWLIGEARNHPTRSKMFSSAVQRCRHIRMELPVEKELQRFVNSAWQQYLDITCQKISGRLGPEIREKMDKCLDFDPKDKERYEWIQVNPRKFGMKTLLGEIRRLQFINEIGINIDLHLSDVPDEVLKLLRERAAPEGAYQMKRHPSDIKYALLAALLHSRQMELTDNIIDIFLQLIRRIEKKADKKLERDLIGSIKTVYKKKEFLYKMAKAVTQNPHGTVEDVVFPVVGIEILNKIVAEYEGQELSYENTQTAEKKKRYTGSYRRMMKPVLDILIFQTTNPARQPLLDGIALVRKYLLKKHVCYPETAVIPEGLKLTGPWKEMLFEDEFGNQRIIKHYFELFILQNLEKALKNKEVWVEGSYRYRNPDKDMPQDLVEKWGHYCDKHKIPDRSEDFINPIREELTQALGKANEFFGEKRDVYIYYPGNGEKGVFRIPKIVKGPDHPILTEIKQKTMDRWGIIDLSDILIEADRQVNFSRFFYSTAQRQVLGPNEIRERLLLSLLGRGTGLGLKRIHTAAKPYFSYEDLVYFNKRYVHIDSLQEANAALANRILEVRSPELWGDTTACTSDGKYLGS